MDQQEEKQLYIDEPCVVAFSISELGWFLQWTQGVWRFIKHTKFKDLPFVVFMNPHLHAFVNDFVKYTIDFPKEFYNLGLEGDCFEAVVPGSPPGSLTPPEVYADIISYIRTYYNPEKAIEIFPPRGCNQFAQHFRQIFCRYTANKVNLDKPIITVLPRKRARAPQRNVPEFIWYQVINELSKQFVVVLGGTPNGAACVDMEGENIINLIRYNEHDKTERLIEYLCSSVCSLSSQSGGTHISLLCDCPSYIIGHEKYRHSVELNRFNTPTAFRELLDYRAIDVNTILNDVFTFLDRLKSVGYKRKESNPINRPSLQKLVGRKDLIGAEIGVYKGDNALNILNNLDIKKLYLIDPYTTYDDLEIVNGTSKSELLAARKTAHEVLRQFGDKVVFIEDKSSNAVDRIREQLDFVYIDGNHRYKYVLEDINLYYPLVKEGGLIAGHDFDESSNENGVVQAVNEFFKDVQIYSQVCQDDANTKDWWVFKPTDIDYILDESKVIFDALEVK